MKRFLPIIFKLPTAAIVVLAILGFGSFFQIPGCGSHDLGLGPADAGGYSISATYDTVRSYPKGGAITVVHMKPGNDYTGTVTLRLEADPKLNASLSVSSFNSSNTVTEILIRPAADVGIGSQVVSLFASHNGVEKRLDVFVDVQDWQGLVSEAAEMKRGEFHNWLIQQNPEYEDIFNTGAWVYGTYPNILVVEHYTYLTPKYEVRMCFHVMVHPYEWSKMRIRRRTSPYPEFAALRETDGNIRRIPVEDYGEMGGY